jgi:predicted Zn-dependent protease
MKAFATTVLVPLSALVVFAQDTKATGQAKKTDPAAIGDRKVSGKVNFYSLEQEIALGKQLAIEVEKQARIVDDPIVSEYVNRLGQNLVRNSDVTFPVSFKIINSEEINAFTLPGGHIFIHTGLMNLSANESELASALAHELGHAAARHVTRQATRSRIFSLSTIPLAVFGGWGGLAARQTADVAIPMAFFKFSREFENEADLLGIQYLWKSGYDPNASIDLFETLESTERRKPGSVSRLFRTHPLTADRIEKTQKNIDKLLPARPEYVINTSEYEEIRARLQDLLPAGKAGTPDSDRPHLRKAPTRERESADRLE